MKVAICISGFMRTWEYSRKSFEEKLCKYIEPDIFIHTYRQNKYETSSGQQDVIYTDNDFDTFFRNLNVKQRVIEDRDIELKKNIENSQKFALLNNYSNEIKESSDSNSTYVSIGCRIYDQLRKIEKCNNLRIEYEQKNNVKYDLVLRCRFDCLYISEPNWNVFSDNKLHNGYGAMWGVPDDMIFAGPPKIMDNYFCNRFSELDNMFTDVNNSFCAHATINYLIELKNKKVSDILGCPFIETRVLRSHSKIHVPGLGSTFFHEYKNHI